MDKITQYTPVTQPFIATDYFDVSKHVTQTSGTLIIGKEYTILDFNTGDNFSNIANVISGTINTTGCVFIATGTTPTTYSNGSTLAYYQSQKATAAQIGGLPKVYEARLSQENTDAPTDVELINTTGITTTWQYDAAGSYYLPLVGVDPAKITVQISSDTYSVLLSARPTTAYGDTAVFVYSTDISGTLSDDSLNNASIIIKIFP